ncbi:MAG TPA: hypothetical protein PKE29_02715 [Phycisphaerales bacterium]|nr:hypothetical protein [Phycisphaerales bacterium]
MPRSIARILHAVAFLVAVSCVFIFVGCRASSGPYAPQTDVDRNPIEAQRLTMRAADALSRNPPKLDDAEKLLRQALTADLYHGPAHNDLGVVCLKKGDLYAAASEFEWAKKLMPSHPDPRLNLGLTLERAGRTTDAQSAYASALEVYPGHIPTLQALTRLEVKHHLADDHTRDQLAKIALEGDGAVWREWAKRTLLLGNSATSTARPSD